MDPNATTQRPLALILTAHVGAGHDALGRAIQAELEGAGCRTVLADGLSTMSPTLAWLLRRLYALLVLRPAGPWGFAVWLFDRRPVARAAHRAAGMLFGGRLLTLTGEIGPDVVVSTYPAVSGALGWLRGRGRLPAPVLAPISDYGVHAVWVAPGVDLHLAPAEVSARTARRAGGSVWACAIPVGPAFHHAPPRDEARASLGIAGGAFVTLITGGSLGMGDLGDAATCVTRAGATTVAVVVTGHNERRCVELTRHFSGDPRVRVLGWSDRMPALMAAADCLIVNAGGMTCLEAAALGLPIVSYRPVPGHGTLNARAMAEAGLAVWARSPEELTGLLAGAASGRAPLPRPAAEKLPSFAAAIVAECAWGGPAREPVAAPVTAQR